MSIIEIADVSSINIGKMGIPASWRFDRIKNIGSVNGRVGWKALKASEYVEEGYFFLSTPNIKGRHIDYVNVNYITKERYYESPEIMLKENDILLTKDGSTLGTVNIVEGLPAAGTVNSSIAVLRFKRGYVNKYFFWLIKSDFVQNVIQLKKDGMGVPHLFQKDINNFLLLIPPVNEQKIIVSFLDRKTFAIDKKISLLVDKITYYQELIKSLISQVVCQGLNKNVSLVESNYKWIGKIPKHWELKRVDALFNERSEKVSDRIFPPLSVSMGGIVPQMEGTAKTQNNDDRKKVLRGDFVINSRSDRRGASGLSNYSGSVSVINIVLKPKKNTVGSFYHHLFRSYRFTEEFYKNGKGIVDDLWSTKFNILKTFILCVPPIEEQIAIAKYLDLRTQVIHSIIENIKLQISGLKELRKSLINDVVIGKFKVTE